MDEFDDEPCAPALTPGEPRPASEHRRTAASAPRLLARLYRVSDLRLRARVLTCLIQPLSILGLAGVSAGAFAAFAMRAPVRDLASRLDEVGRFTGTQVMELARFAEQVSPEAMQQAAAMLSENPLNTAAFAASTALLLVRRLGRN